MLNKLKKAFKNKHFNDYSFQLLNYSVSIVSGIFVGAYVARYIGPEGLGILAIFSTLVWFSNTTNDLGSNQYIVKSFSGNKNGDIDMFWSLLFLIRIPLSLLFFATSYLALKHGLFENAVGLDSWVILLGLTAICISPISQFNQLVVANVKNGELAKYGMAVLLITAVLRVLCVMYGSGLEAFIFIQSALSFLSLFTLFFIILKNKLMPPMGKLTYPKAIQTF